MNNLFQDLQVPETGETFEPIIKNDQILIERIVSSDKPDSKIYNQNHDKWVMLLEGSAELNIEEKVHSLKKGDTILIQAGQKHQVLKTARGTMWLAVHA